MRRKRKRRMVVMLGLETQKGESLMMLQEMRNHGQALGW